MMHHLRLFKKNMTSKNIYASVIVVSWNTKELLRTCLQGLVTQEGVALEIFVVDNNSLDGTQEMVCSEFSTVKLITNIRNAGFAAANNQALQVAKGNFVVLINPDIEFTSTKTLKVLLECQQKDKFGIAGPKLLNSDKTTQQSVRSDPTFTSQLLTLLKIHVVFPKLKKFNEYYLPDFNYSISRKVKQLSGAFFSISRECYSKVGLLDESFYIWFEEVDYCLRAREAGFNINYVSEISVIHHGGQSFQKVIPVNRQKIFNRSLLLFAKKYFTHTQFLLLKIFSPISVVLAFVTPKKVKPFIYKVKA